MSLILSVVVPCDCVVCCAAMIWVTVVPVQVYVLHLCFSLLSPLQCLLVFSAGLGLESCV
jgi:hypothetical protein